MKKRSAGIPFIFCILFLILGGVVYSQTSAQNTIDFSVAGFETGFALSYDIATGGIGNGQVVGIRTAIGNNFDLGFITIVNPTGNLNQYQLLGLGYGVADRFGMTLYLGQQQTPAPTALAGGFDFSINAFEHSFQNTVNTSLKLRLFYLFSFIAGIASGDFGVGITLNFGI